jgi:VWFA-related protein
LQNALQRLAASPGQHTLVLVSPGFVAPGREQDFSKIIDLALHADIIISTLDARGLYNIDSVASNSRANLDYRRESASANAELLATLADATGGTFFHNSNDLEAGFQRVTETPDYSYILGFAPEDRELDGRFHSLSVTLNTPQKVTVQARKGYYAPKRATQ